MQPASEERGGGERQQQREEKGNESRIDSALMFTRSVCVSAGPRPAAGRDGHVLSPCAFPFALANFSSPLVYAPLPVLVFRMRISLSLSKPPGMSESK